jgi:hypothetical protein
MIHQHIDERKPTHVYVSEGGRNYDSVLPIVRMSLQSVG